MERVQGSVVLPVSVEVLCRIVLGQGKYRSLLLLNFLRNGPRPTNNDKKYAPTLISELLLTPGHVTGRIMYQETTRKIPFRSVVFLVTGKGLLSYSVAFLATGVSFFIPRPVLPSHEKARYLSRGPASG